MDKFIEVKKELIGECKVGDVFGLKVVSIGETVELGLERIKDSEEARERIDFDKVFERKVDGVETLIPLKINGLGFNAGTFVKSGISLAGIDFTPYIGRDLSVVKEGEYYKLLGMF